jgi:hypothetical protein
VFARRATKQQVWFEALLQMSGDVMVHVSDCKGFMRVHGFVQMTYDAC